MTFKMATMPIVLHSGQRETQFPLLNFLVVTRNLENASQQIKCYTVLKIGRFMPKMIKMIKIDLACFYSTQIL